MSATSRPKISADVFADILEAVQAGDAAFDADQAVIKAGGNYAKDTNGVLHRLIVTQPQSVKLCQKCAVQLSGMRCPKCGRLYQ